MRHLRKQAPVTRLAHTGKQQAAVVIASEGGPGPYGDGHVHRAFAKASDDAITATGQAAPEGHAPQALRESLTRLDQDWRDWHGTCTATETTLEATHHGTGHLRIAVTLRRAQRTYDPDAWPARIMLALQAREQLRELASAADQFLRPTPLNGVRNAQNCQIGTARSPP